MSVSPRWTCPEALASANRMQGRSHRPRSIEHSGILTYSAASSFARRERPPSVRSEASVELELSGLKRHAAGNFYALAVDPAIIFGQQRRDHRADVVRLTDAPKRGHVGNAFVDLGIVANHAAAEIGR